MKKHLLTQSDIRVDKYFLFYLAIIYLLYFAKASPSVFLITSGFISIFFFGWIISKEYKENSIKITPVLVLAIIPFLMLGVSSVYQGIMFLDTLYTMLGPRYISTQSVIIGYLMVATGLFFQLIGIQIFRPQYVSPTNPNISSKRLYLFGYLIIFLLLSKFTEEFLRLGIIQNIINTIPVAILIFVAINDKNNLITSYAYKRNVILFGSCLLFVSNLVLLSKTVLVLSIIPVFLFYLIQSIKKEKYKPIISMLMAGILYFLFIQPLVSNARLFLLKYQEEPSANFVSSYIVSGNYKYPIYKSVTETNAVEIFLNRMFEVNAPAYIYELTERSGFQYGRTFDNIAIGMIPRIFWPEKPDIPQGQRFSTDVLGFEKVSIGMLISGELYWNFGFPGIIIGSLLIGLALGYMWKLINPLALENYFYFAIYFYLLQASLGGSEFSAVFVGSMQLLVLFFIIRQLDFFISKRK